MRRIEAQKCIENYLMASDPSFGSNDQADFSDIRLLALDFDGVLTNNKVYVFPDGSESVRCDRGDSMGLLMLKDTDIEAIVVSRETDRIVKVRCEKMGVPVVHGVVNKLGTLMDVCGEKGLQPHEVAFMGNDINDVECMSWASVAIAPTDAHHSALEVANFVTSRRGGDGAVREITDLLMDAHAARLMADIE